jgi:hypothetical protein
MLFRPFLLLYRGRLIATLIFWLGGSLVVLFSHSGAQLFGWYFFPCFWTGAFLGGWWQNSRPFNREAYFLFTRPIPRSAVILRPLAIACFAIAVFAILPLGRRIFAPTHSARFYLGGVSIGLCGYTLAVSRRWLGLSSNLGLRILGGLFGLTLPLSICAGLFALPPDPLSPLFDSAFLRFLFLWTPSRSSGSHLPSIMGIVLHFAFAAGVLYGCWRMIQGIDELPEPSHSSVEEIIRAARARS